MQLIRQTDADATREITTQEYDYQKERSLETILKADWNTRPDQNK